MLPEYIPGTLRTASGEIAGSITLAAGDLSVSIDGGAFAARATLPTVTDGQYELQLTSLERAAQRLVFAFHDQDGVDFADQRVNIIDDGEVVADAILSRSVTYIETTMPQHCLGTLVLAVLEWAINNATNELIIKGTDGATTRFVKPLSEAPDDGTVITGVS